MPQSQVGDSVIYVRSQQPAVVTQVLPMRRGMQIYQIFVNGQ